MFSRRHPYLFFLLVFSAIWAGSFIIISSFFSVATHRPETGDRVGVIEINGLIADSKQILEHIKLFREDDSVKAIVIRIDSPGGSIGPSQEIYREIQKTLKEKHVIASLGALAASGGYYIASAAEGIIANPGTITGSIGVIMGYTNFQQIMEKIGLVPVVFKSGEFKDSGSPVREMTGPEKALLQAFIDKLHDQFVRDVSQGRGMDPARVKMLSDGRLYTGEEAVDLGLVDRLGNFEDAVAWAGELSGIQGKVNVEYPPKKKFDIRDYLEPNALHKIFRDLMIPEIRGGYLYTPPQQG